MRSRDRGLERLRDRLRSVDAAEVEMITERGRFDAIAGEGPTRAISAFNLFQTPKPIAAMMAARLGECAGCRVLEPSAGLGRIIRAIPPGAEITAVEFSPQCAGELFRLDGLRLIQDDFLSCDVERLGGLFDFVVMNPPFKQGRDIKHIRHAFEMLKPGGLLVSLCFDGVRQNSKLKPWADTWEVLPPSSFKAEGTRASVAMLTKRRTDA